MKRYGMGLAAFVVVLLLTGASFWRFSTNSDAATPQVATPDLAPVPIHAPALASLAQDTSDETDQGVSGGWPDGLSVLPEDGAQACPTTSIWAMYPLNADASAVMLMLDGVDVTAQSQITPDGTITYQRPSLLSAGSHEASISFPDPDSVMQTYTWTFDVAGGAACQQAPTGAPPAPPAAEPPAAAPPLGAPPAAIPPAGAPPAGAPSGPSGPALGALPSQGVLHIIAEHSWISPQGETQRTEVTETWLNLSSGEARATVKDASGTELSTTIRSGQSLTLMVPQEKRASTTVFPDPNRPELSVIRGALLGSRSAYEQGQLQFINEETIDGVTAEHAQATLPDSSVVEVWLRKDYGLILREVAYRPGTAREVAQTHVVNYRLVEVVPSVSPDIWSPTIPSDWGQVTDRILTQQDAAGMHDFDLYWLGTDYQGMTLLSITQETISGPPPQGAPPGAPTGPQTTIIAQYATAPPPPPTGGQAAQPPQQPPAPNGITIAERRVPAQAAQPPQNQPGRPGQSGGQGQFSAPPGAEQVTVNGNRGFIPQLPPPPTPQPSQGQQAGPPPNPPTILVLPVGNTVLEIQGKDRASVMQAAQDLKRLN